MSRHWIYWIMVWTVGAFVGASGGLLLRAQGATLGGNAVLITTALLTHAIIAGGVLAWVQKRWALLTGIYLALGIAAALLTIPLLRSGEAALGMLALCLFASGRLVFIIRVFAGTTRLMLPAILLLWTWDLAMLAGTAIRSDMKAIATVVIGTYAIMIVFWAGLWLIRAMLSGPLPVFGVARTLINEAIRMKVSLIFIVVLLVLIPVLPTFDDERLQYKLQTFLSWSFTIVSILLGLMTVFLSSATICNEIDRHQVYLTLTKPIPRTHYLFGKWLGISLLNLLLLTVVCIGIYTFARLIQVSGVPRDEADRAAVTWQLLTARKNVHPTPDPERFKIMIQARAKELQTTNRELGIPPELTAKQRESIQQTVLTKWHTLSTASPQAFYFHGLDNAKQRAISARAARERKQLQKLEMLAGQTADPQQAARYRQWAETYLSAIEQRKEALRLRDLARTTTGTEASERLAEARRMQAESFERLVQVRRDAAVHLQNLLRPGPREVIQLRFKPRASGDTVGERVAIEIRVNGFLFPQGNSQIHTLADNNFHILNLPAENAVDNQGTMMLEMANRSIAQDPGPDGKPRIVPTSMTPGEGLEILYAAGTFENNVVRCLLMIWIQLCFLAMLGLMAGTFLGFPVASVMCLLVFSASTVGGFLHESLRYYVSIPTTSVTFSDQAHSVWMTFVTYLGDGKIWDAAKIVIGLVGKMFVAMIPSFHDHNPVPLVTDGRLISTSQLGSAVGWIGGVATGSCAIVACVIFRIRELARVMV